MNPLDAGSNSQRQVCELENLDLPQKVVPRVNHWIPDANANNVGVLERITPPKPPTTSPDMPNNKH